MKIIHYSEAETKSYTGNEVQGVAGRVVIGKADGANKFCMRVFELAKEGYTAKHSHDWEHEVFVHGGKGAVFQNGSWIPLTQGSTVFIPPNEEHQLKNLGNEPFVFVCVIPSGAPEI